MKGLSLRDVEVSYLKEDLRPAFLMNDVSSVDLHNVKGQHAADVSTFVLKNVSDFNASQWWPFADTRLGKIDLKKF